MTVPPTPREVADVDAVRHRTVTVDGVRLYFREAGDPRHPTLVLLHGFPSRR